MMIGLALKRIKNGETKSHKVEVFHFSNLPKFFGVAVYSFMCQHSLPSIITPVINKRRINLVLLVDFLLVAAFYTFLVLTAVFAFAENILEDLYTLNFGSSPAFCKYFLELFPVFTLSTNFPIIVITLSKNLKTFLKEGKHYGLFVSRYLFPPITVIPPVLIAFATKNVEVLVAVTGSYAASIIQYVISVTIVFYG